ncbi:XRE family transcriptional regulator [Actinoplanes sp. TFC3]|uniref:XRE family transcriptional regulator n=1 Tax=Actinoplanes sp. TFC3 TaxID=1710355 RepID=UPI000835AFDB|nr:XRE family transcriptional regulator [Actinoplanes sp. TFC3]
MANERLRDALDRARVTPAELALHTETDIKTVSRWIGGRVPHPRTRFKIAKRLKEDEDFLWPGARKASPQTTDTSGIVQFYNNRGAVPATLWDRLLDAATGEVGILVYVGMFLTEKPDLLTRLRAKANTGVRVRVLLGDRNADAVKQRSHDEGIGRETISAKIDQADAFFRPLIGTANIDLRHHGTVLYNSIYRFDNDMIVNPHIYGKTAPMAPAMHVRRTSTFGLFDAYTESFEAVWDAAMTQDGGQAHAED